jgi:DNA-binding response OmpR family regulator
MENKQVLILLNDKDPVLTRVSKVKFKKEAGWEVIIPTSIDDALNLFELHHPNVVVTEIILNDNNGRSGFDFIELIKKSPTYNNTRLVVLTSLSQDSDKKRAATLGVTSYFVKSQISIKDFMGELKKTLET